MKTVPFKPTATEWLELINIPQYKDFSYRAIFNTAILVTHATMERGKRLTSTGRDDYSKIPQLATPLQIKANKQFPPVRRNAELEHATFLKLNEIKVYNCFPSMADTVAFCLRSLRVYTDAKGTDVIGKWEKTDYDQPSHKKEQVLLRLPQDVIDFYKVRAVALDKSYNRFIADLLIEEARKQTIHIHT